MMTTGAVGWRLCVGRKSGGAKCAGGGLWTASMMRRRGGIIGSGGRRATGATTRTEWLATKNEAVVGYGRPGSVTCSCNQSVRSSVQAEFEPPSPCRFFPSAKRVPIGHRRKLPGTRRRWLIATCLRASVWRLAPVVRSEGTPRLLGPAASVPPPALPRATRPGLASSRRGRCACN